MKLKQNSAVDDFENIDVSKYQSLQSCNLLQQFYPFTQSDNFDADRRRYELLSASVRLLGLALKDPYEWNEKCEVSLAELRSVYEGRAPLKKQEKIDILTAIVDLNNVTALDIYNISLTLAEEVQWNGQLDTLVMDVLALLGLTVEFMSEDRE